MKYFSMIMTLIYLVVGVAVLAGYFSNAIPGPYTIPVGLAIVAYGLYRAARLYRQLVKK